MSTNPYKSYKLPSSGGNDLLKLENDKPVKVRIMSEPVAYINEFTRGEETTIDTRYAWIVYNYSVQAVQVFMVPKSAFGHVKKLAESDDWGFPIDYDLTFEKTIDNTITKWSVLPSPNRKSLPQEAYDKESTMDIKEIVSKFPSVQNCFYLDETADDSTQEDLNRIMLGKDEEGAVTEIDDEPIDMSKIPF